MQVVYSSLHNLDLEAETPIRKDIPSDFTPFIRSYIEFATAENKTSREYTPIDKNRTVVNCITQILGAHSNGDPEEAISEFMDSIACKLLDTEKIIQQQIEHLINIQKGSIVQALILDEEVYKYVIAKVEHTEWIDGETFQKNIGFPGENKRVWKSGVFTLNVEDDAILIASIKAYINTQAKYWTDQFLEVKEATSNTRNTKAVVSIVDRVLKPLKTEATQDYYNLRNSFMRQLQTNDLIDYPEMIDKTLDGYDTASSTVDIAQIKQSFLNEIGNGKFDTQFHSDPNVVKKFVKTTFQVSEGIDILVRNAIPDWKNNFLSHEKSDGRKYLMVLCQNTELLRSFSKDQ